MRSDVTHNIGTRIVRALGVQAVGQALRIVQQLLLVPLFIHAWGVERYDDWLLINAGVAFISIFESGLQLYFGGLMQERLVQGDVIGYRRAAHIACSTYLAIVTLALLAIGIASLAVDWVAVLGVSRMPRDEAIWTLGILATNCIVQLPFGMAQSPYRAHGEFGRSVGISSLGLVAQIAIPAGLLVLDQPTMMVAWGMLVSSLIAWAIMLLDQRVRYGRAPWGFSIPSAGEIPALGKNWIYYNMQAAAFWLTLQGPILLLGHFGSPIATVAFATARTVVGVSRQLTIQFAYPFAYEISVLLNRKEIDTLNRLLRNAVSVTGIVGGLLVGITLVAGAPLIALWLHHSIAVEPSLIAALGIAVALTAPAQVFFVMLNFSNRPRLIAHAYLSYAVVGLLIGLALVHPFRATGVAIGLGVGEVIWMGGYLSFQASRQIGVGGLRIVEAGLFRAALACGFGYGVAALIVQLLPPTDYFRMAALGIIWAFIAGPVAFFLLLNGDQRAAILRRIPSSR